jgi:hypothetical protein
MLGEFESQPTGKHLDGDLARRVGDPACGRKRCPVFEIRRLAQRGNQDGVSAEAISGSIAGWTVLSVPSRLTLKTRCASPGLSKRTVAGRWVIPALQRTRSSLPNCSRTRSIAAAIASRSVTSAPTTRARTAAPCGVLVDVDRAHLCALVAEQPHLRKADPGGCTGGQRDRTRKLSHRTSSSTRPPASPLARRTIHGCGASRSKRAPGGPVA